MKPSEELMLLLELNGFDITKFKLKKQLEYEQNGNLELYKHKKYADLVLAHYDFKPNEDYAHRNPLTYRTSWGESVSSLDQYIVNHPDFENEMTLKEFLQLDEFNDINRESILYDVLDKWVEEYREASITQMENLRTMIKLLPRKRKKYKKPSKILFLFSVIFALVAIMLYKSPESLTPSFFSFLGTYIDGYVQLLFDVPWYSLFGLFVIFLLLLYAVLNNFVSRYIRDVRSEKNKHAERTFDKWEQDMKDQRLKQAGILEDYVDAVVKKPDNSELDVKLLVSPEVLMQKFKDYVMMIERRYDRMTKYYKRFMLYLRLLYVFSVFMLLVFYGVGFALQQGWIGNV